jgi:hypothetical protein
MPKPIHQRLTAVNPSGKQMIWERIRARRDAFTLRDIFLPGRESKDAVKKYIVSLMHAGFVVESSRNRLLGDRRHQVRYRLVKDTGIDAPRLTLAGRPVTAGNKRQQLWRTMKRLRQFTVDDLRLMAGTDDSPVDFGSADVYCRFLAKAGYVRVSEPGRTGKHGRLTVYEFVRAKDTGPKAPVIQRVNTVFDPNLREIVYHPELAA